MKIRSLGAALAAVFCLPVIPLKAASFADQVISYLPGEGASLTNASAALGSPDDLTGEQLGFPNVLSPFSPPFEADEIVQIGEGGRLTLRLANFVTINRTPGVRELGVFENVGFADAAFPNGTTGNPVAVFGIDTAVVEVSEDGATWFSLGPVTFDIPANFYTNAGPFDSAPPASPGLADFGKPFTGALAAFNGKTYPQVLAILDGSGGGTWLDLDSAPVSQVGYVRFSGVPPGATLDLDAVSINQSLAAAPVPEPDSALLLVLGLAGLWQRRRSRFRTSGALACLLAGAGFALPLPATAGLLNETFSDNPVAAGRAVVIGDATRFTYDAAGQALDARYNTNFATTLLRWDLGTTLTAASDFSFTLDFTVHSTGEATGTGQIAFGLINHVTTGPDRAGGNGGSAYDLAGVDYFPGAFESVGPTVINSAGTAPGGFFNNIRFTFGKETSLREPGETPLDRDVMLTAVYSYSAGTRIATLRLTGDNTPVNLAGPSPNPAGFDNDPDTIQVKINGSDSFNVDAFAITLWEDSFRDPNGGLAATVTFDNIIVVPEPMPLHLAGAGMCLWYARRRRT